VATLDVLTVGEAEKAAGRHNNYLLLRLVAACAVVYGHSYALAPAPGQFEVCGHYLRVWVGGLALWVFFVLSGFLVTASYLTRNSLSVFLAARGLRLLPGLAVCLVLTTFVLGPLATSLPVSKYLADPQTREYFSNNLLLLREVRFALPGVFAHNPDTAVNGPLWSIHLEARLYLAVAALGLVGLLRHKGLFNLVVPACLLVGTFGPKCFSFLGTSSTDLTCCLLFALGALMYINRERMPLHGGVLCLLILLAALSYNTDRYLIAVGALVTYGVFWLAYVPQLPWFNRMGDYSYGVYLYGWPVAQVMKQLVPASGPLRNTVLTLPVTFVLAFFSWHLVEKPALSLKRFVPAFSWAGVHGLWRRRTAPRCPDQGASPAATTVTRRAA
jgi:peptidoglycan/LPS O-acetylase OafA/YrhL